MRPFGGGSDGNEQLTAIVATVLLVLLAIEGATLLNLQSLLTIHAFVGMLLIPVVALKSASRSMDATSHRWHGFGLFSGFTGPVDLPLVATG